MSEQDLRGKTVVVTGASSGIGRAAAIELHARGATVHVVGRSPERTAAAASDVGTEPIVADFARLSDVRRTAEAVMASCERLDVLVNNAGLSLNRREETEDGHEKTFQVNHLAPFLLTSLLTPLLVRSAPSRVVTTASVANLNGFVRLNDLETRRFFVGPAVYGTTKLENILFTRELGRRLQGTGVLATCFNPGLVDTDLGRGNLTGLIHHSPLRRMMKSPESGADTLVWLATAPADELRQGGYYSNRRLGLVNAQAMLRGLGPELWSRTERLLASEGDDPQDGSAASSR
jgi:NAD(P)-dependent dehydrogenase (short-subunit alcohol dehydrogenase family)